MTDQGERTYKIGHAAQILGVEPYVLRYWETEFTHIRPIRTPKGQRLYTESHLRLIRRIKVLLYDHGLTIEGARKKLESDHHWHDLLADLHSELQAIRETLLSGPVQPGHQATRPCNSQRDSGQEQRNQNRDQQTQDDAVDHREQ